VTLAFRVDADEEFLDQESVVENDVADRGHLLISQV
jgi:hypothetical protein